MANEEHVGLKRVIDIWFATDVGFLVPLAMDDEDWLTGLVIRI